MRRWELAKKKGLNWQVVLLQDCETDIKVITLESIKMGEDFKTTNRKVTELIKTCVNELESESLKALAKSTLPKFATRIYLKWLPIYGLRQQGIAFLSLLYAKNVLVPEITQKRLSNLPKTYNLELGYNRATSNMDYERNITEQINRILDEKAKEDYSLRYTLRAGAERQVRYEWQQNQLKKLYESGNDLVWINTHANCSKRCEEWQGKLYSISGKYGVVDGIEYQPLSNATDRYETTKSGKTYINGTLTGFNCRHTTTPYSKGNKPTHIPEDVIEKQRAIETKQRQLERTIRQYESRAIGWRVNRKTALTKEERQLASTNYAHNRKLVVKWQNKYIKFSKENNVPYYPSRIKV